MVRILDLVRHPGEIRPIAQALLAAKRAERPPADPDLAFCYGILPEVSRRYCSCQLTHHDRAVQEKAWLTMCWCSFAIVIQQLPRELQDAVCIFYLALRALDTIEDDMSIPAEDKIPRLHSFYKDSQDRCACSGLPQLVQPRKGH